MDRMDGRRSVAPLPVRIVRVPVGGLRWDDYSGVSTIVHTVGHVLNPCPNASHRHSVARSAASVTVLEGGIWK